MKGWTDSEPYEVIKEFLEALDEITTAEHDHSTKAGLVSKVFFNKLGIKIPPSVFKDTEMAQVSKDFTNDSSAESIFGKFRDSLRNLTLEGADLNQGDSFSLWERNMIGLLYRTLVEIYLVKSDISIVRLS